MCRLNSSAEPLHGHGEIADGQVEVEKSFKSPLLGFKNYQAAKLEEEEKSCLSEAGATLQIAIPMVLTGLLLYSRSMISVLFLGRLGHLPLAGGSLAVGFANITGYSILSGLAMGMEPICGQAFGAGRHKVLGQTLQKAILLLLLTAIPISLLWFNVERILLACRQDPDIASLAQTYLLFSLPDLLAQSFLHPLRIYLRSQSITLPLTLCAGITTALHVPINYLLVTVLGLGVRGVALGSAWTNINMVLALVVYVVVSKVYEKTWPSEGVLYTITTTLFGFSFSFFCHSNNNNNKNDNNNNNNNSFKSLLSLAVPSCVSVCLEWWWYEIMILLCGLLANPTATVASMGILIQTTSLIYIFPSSLSFGVSTRVANHLGAGRPDRARRAAVSGLFIGLLVGISALYFAVSVRRGWARMFTDDNDVAALTAAVLPVIGLCELGNCPQTSGCGVLRGTARPKVGARLNLACFYLVGMPVAVWLGFFGGFGFKGLWLGLMAAQWSCVLTMMWVVARTDWDLEAKRAYLLTSDHVHQTTTTTVPVINDDVETGKVSSSSCTVQCDTYPQDHNQRQHPPSTSVLFSSLP